MCVSVNYFRHVVHHLQSLSPIQSQLAPMDLLSLRNLESKAVRGRRSASQVSPPCFRIEVPSH